MNPRPRRNRILLALAAFVVINAGTQESIDTSAFPVPVYLGSDYLGEHPIRFTPDDQPLIRTRSLVEFLAPQLSDDIIDEALARYAEPVWGPLEEITALGFTVVLDWETLALIVTIPPDARRPETISMRGLPRTPRGTRVAQAPFSLISNMDLWTRYNYETTNFDIAFTPDIAINILGSVIEVRGGVRDEAPVLFLDHFRFIQDFPAIAYRLEVGDLTFNETRLGNLSGLTGVSFVRSPAMLPPVQPGGEFVHELVLDHESELVVVMNETSTQTRQLDAGKYEVTGFPFVEGLNTITLDWTGQDGPRQVEIVVSSDPGLLRLGEIDAGLAVGLADRDYLRPVVASYQAAGLTDSLTVGLREGLEPMAPQVDIGAQMILATLAGTFRLDPDVLIGPAGKLVVDVPIGYRFLDSRPSRYRSFGVTAGFSTARPDTTVSLANTIYASGFYNLAFADGFSVTPRVYYSWSPAGRGHFFQLRAGLRKSIRGGSSLSGDLGFVYDQGPQFSATVSYAVSFPEAQQNLFLQQDLDAQEFSAYWSRYAGEDSRDIDFNLSAQVPVSFDDQLNLSGQVGYNNPYVRAVAAHGFTGIFNQSQFTNATTARFQTSVVMASGVFAMTLPVNDSFVIVAPGESTLETRLGINRTGAGADLELLGSVGVLPSVLSYAPAEITAESEDLILGSDDRELRYHVLPGYRSGTLVTVDLERNIYVGGVLAESDESVLPYLFGSWRKTGDSPGTSIDLEATSTGEFFTDADGYFEIYALSPGIYELSLIQRPDLIFTFEVPADATEFHDLQTIVAEVTG